MKKPSRRPSKPARKPRGTDPDQMNQATTDEFEREDMGIAPKE